MPFELGLAYARKYRRSHKGAPELLVMDREVHRFKRFLSDLKGCDAASHGGDPLEAITKIRNWLSSYEKSPLNGPIHMRDWFNRFQSDMPSLCEKAGFHRTDMAFKDLVFCVLYWLDRNAPLRDLTF